MGFKCKCSRLRIIARSMFILQVHGTTSLVLDGNFYFAFFEPLSLVMQLN